MKILVACEFSGVVRSAFRARGHDAWSCDLEPAEDSSAHHIRGDAIEALLRGGWDLVIAHPPCTYLCNSGVRWLYQGGRGTVRNAARWAAMQSSASFFLAFLSVWEGPVAIENPIMHRYAAAIIDRKPSQIIQPWQFGHGETKATCLWLRNVPALQPTNIVAGRKARVHHASPGANRWKERSRTLPGIAAAMAEQWSVLA